LRPPQVTKKYTSHAFFNRISLGSYLASYPPFRGKLRVRVQAAKTRSDLSTTITSMSNKTTFLWSKSCSLNKFMKNFSSNNFFSFLRHKRALRKIIFRFWMESNCTQCFSEFNRKLLLKNWSVVLWNAPLYPS